MTMLELIEKKKNGGALTEQEIAFFVRGICDGTIPDYQTSAFLMAVCFNGMTSEETAILTDHMAKSGKMLDLSALAPTADKHSTGGVGDKTSLIAAPIAAACGVNVAKMSGRGLGHTGGTIDKLESIPHLKTEIDETAFFRQVKETGIAIIAQSGAFVPADKILYALRDVTATVNSLPLIASSIMSKKLASGSESIVLDVKTGSGAFMKTPDDAKSLAEEMVKIGKQNGRNMAALITDMNTPLGTHIGNSLEIKEVIEVLRGGGDGTLRDICLSLAAQMIALAKNIPVQAARPLAEQALTSGKALAKFKQMVAAQGGDTTYIDCPEQFENAAFSLSVKAPKNGYLHTMDAEKIGKCAALLGAGRTKKGDAIDFAAGIVLKRKMADFVACAEPIATLYTNREQSLPQAERLFLSAIEITQTAPAVTPHILEVIT